MIDGEFHSHFVSEVGEAFADIKVGDERFLTEYMFSRSQRCFDERRSIGRRRLRIDGRPPASAQRCFGSSLRLPI